MSVINNVINKVMAALKKRGADAMPEGDALRVVHLPENRRKAVLLIGGAVALVLVCLPHGWDGAGSTRRRPLTARRKRPPSRFQRRKLCPRRLHPLSRLQPLRRRMHMKLFKRRAFNRLTRLFRA